MERGTRNAERGKEARAAQRVSWFRVPNSALRVWIGCLAWIRTKTVGVKTRHAAVTLRGRELVEPEVVATSPCPGKSRMPVCCGFDSSNWCSRQDLHLHWRRSRRRASALGYASKVDGAGERSRTVVSALARPHSAVEPHPREMVGMKGLAPPRLPDSESGPSAIRVKPHARKMVHPAGLPPANSPFEAEDDNNFTTDARMVGHHGAAHWPCASTSAD